MAETDRAQEVVRRLLDAEKSAQARLARPRSGPVNGSRAPGRKPSASAPRRRNARRANGSAALASARNDAEAEAAALVAAEQDRWQRIGDAAHSRTDAAVDEVVAWVCADDDAEPFP